MILRSVPLVAFLLVAFVASCGGGGGSSVSKGCLSDDDCPDDGVCHLERCLDPLGDDDDDGLPNEVELTLALDPLSADTDADGAPDALEVGDWAAPADRDGDGLLDAAEHDLVDADHDCLPAPQDADEAVAETDPRVLASFLCRHVGACSAAGSSVGVRCVQGAHACDYDQVADYEAVEARCDHVDNDCDGVTDEGATWRGLVPGDACRGEGACDWGTVECRPDGLATCSTNPDGSAPGATAERCNAIDDDCDGFTDEDATYHGVALGAPCDGVGACAAGVAECRPDGGTTCSSNPEGSAHQDTPEACNGQDDDCDGLTDEDVVGSVIDRCPLGGVCAAAFALLDVACVAGHWACDLSAVDGYEPAPETSCDGRDNDCDGLTDEDLAQHYLECPSEGVCSAVPPAVACVGGGWACRFDAVSGYEPVEGSCDGQDNDCDGWTDDGLAMPLDVAWGLSTYPVADVVPPGAWAGALVSRDADDRVLVLAAGTFYTVDDDEGEWSPGWHLDALADDPPDWMGAAANGVHVAWLHQPGTPAPSNRVARVSWDGEVALVPVADLEPGASLFSLASWDGAWSVETTEGETVLTQLVALSDVGLSVHVPDPTVGAHGRLPAVARGGLVHLAGTTDQLIWSPAAPDDLTTVAWGGDVGDVKAAWVDDGSSRVVLKSATSATGWWVSVDGTLAELDAAAPFDTSRVSAGNAAWDGPRRRLVHVGARDTGGALVPGMFQLRAICP